MWAPSMTVSSRLNKPNTDYKKNSRFIVYLTISFNSFYKFFWCPQISKGFFFPWLDGF